MTKTILVLLTWLVCSVAGAANGLLTWQYPQFQTPVFNINVRIFSTNRLVPPPWPLLLSTNVSTNTTSVSIPMTNDVGFFYADIYYTPLTASRTGSVTLAWNASIDPVAGYRVYWGTNVNYYTNTVNASNNLSVQIANLITNVNYAFAATAYDTNGLESDFSTPVRYQLNSTVITNYIPINFVLAPVPGPKPTGSLVSTNKVKRVRIFISPPPAPMPESTTNMFHPHRKNKI